jgi:MtrB/PioB family decaheme-associated outer membrane protein
MKTSTQYLGCRQKVLVIAILSAFAPAYADDDIAQYITPESTVSVGVGAVSGDSKDRALFGQYNGMRKSDVYGLVDFDYIKRDNATGTWTNLQGVNLGLDTRELRFMRQKQGDWKYSAEYSELTRNYPRTINTGLTGAGTTTPVVTRLTSQGSGSDLDLKTERKSASLGMEKWITPNLQFEANFKNEDKDGARIFGRGLTCGNLNAFTTISCPPASGAILLLPEPINSTTRQIDAKLNYSGDKFFLSGAYYGSFFTNENGSLRPTINGNLYNPNGTTLNTATTPGSTLAAYMQQPIALAPDNQAHQLSLFGNYAFTPTTRATFKYAYTHATQNESFADQGLTTAPVGVTSLNGRIDTTLIQAGLTARPTNKLSLLANARYEDKDDKTPLALYSPTAGQTQSDSSMKRLVGKVEASYRLTNAYRATFGVDYESVNRGIPPSTYQPGGLTLLREETRETGYRAELRRSMSETVNGAISYTRSRRDGSGWLNGTVLGTPVIADADAAALAGNRPVTPTMFMDRTRDKIKLSADWSPTEQVSLQFIIEDSKDNYDAPSNGVRKGLLDNGGKLYSIDAGFVLSDAWKLNAYWTQSEQTQNINHSVYMAQLDTKSNAIGLSLTGKPSSKLEIGADLSYVNDKNGYQQAVETTSNTAGTIATANGLLAQGGLPDVTYRATTLKLFGKYALEKNAALRFDLIHMRAKLNEWTWGYNNTPFFYSDYSTVSMQQNQNVTFVGVTYIYKFQ